MPGDARQTASKHSTAAALRNQAVSGAQKLIGRLKKRTCTSDSREVYICAVCIWEGLLESQWTTCEFLSVSGGSATLHGRLSCVTPSGGIGLCRKRKVCQVNLCIREVSVSAVCISGVGLAAAGKSGRVFVYPGSLCVCCVYIGRRAGRCREVWPCVCVAGESLRLLCVYRESGWPLPGSLAVCLCTRGVSVSAVCISGGGLAAAGKSGRVFV